MRDMTAEEIDAVADRLLRAIESGDTAAVQEIYAPDAQIWHNFDEVVQEPSQNLLTLVDMHKRASNLRYTEIRRFPSPGGFVQQHVLVADAKYGPLRMPAIIRFWVTDGRISRLEEYVDTRQAMVMYRPAQ